MDKQSYLLYNDQQARPLLSKAWQIVKAELTAGRKVTVKIEPENKSREQEQKYHAMIGEIAQQAQHLGASWDAESWKRLMVEKFCREIGLAGGRVIPNLDGNGIVQVDYQTRKFTKDQASQFVEFLQAWGAQNGITFKENENGTNTS